ncbi:PAS domain-containing protein [Sneathiella glossodoripedis]|uniref:PAS domain-containing protein n=1 Tax=Sneathiella glossodoripedis TaxID=418853 RepID=UPI00046FD95D|nr:PAS domain-containing protein [Sneathiella glossodoripedis]
MDQPVHESYLKAKSLLETVTQWQLKGLLEYWLEIHPKTHLPARNDLDPIHIPKLLPYVTMTDVERNPFRLRMRLVGTAVNSAFGKDFTRKYFDEVFPNYETAQGYKQRREVADTGLPAHYFGQGALRYNLDFKSVEWVLLPFASDGETVDIIISTISYGRE